MRLMSATEMAIEELRAAIENVRLGDLGAARGCATEAARLIKVAEREEKK